MTDQPLASDLSYECLQKRRRTGELSAPVLHQPDRRVQPARGATRAAILRERLTGEAEPLRWEVGSEARHGS